MTTPIGVSSPCIVIFRARIDVPQGEAVTPENCEGLPTQVDGLRWMEATAAGETGRVSVPAFGMEQLPPVTFWEDEDD